MTPFEIHMFVNDCNNDVLAEADIQIENLLCDSFDDFEAQVEAAAQPFYDQIVEAVRMRIHSVFGVFRGTTIEN